MVVMSHFFRFFENYFENQNLGTLNFVLNQFLYTYFRTLLHAKISNLTSQLHLKPYSKFLAGRQSVGTNRRRPTVIAGIRHVWRARSNRQPPQPARRIFQALCRHRVIQRKRPRMNTPAGGVAFF